MIEFLVGALLLVTAASAYLAGRLIERAKRVAETGTLLAQTQLENRAFQNQLLVRQGHAPIFKADGVIALSHIPDNVPVSQILRPPFAQAELDWEAEEEKPMTVQEIFKPFVPGLTEAQKAEMLATDAVRSAAIKAGVISPYYD